MAINKVVYNTENGAETLIDLTGDTVTSETLTKGVTAHDKSGTTITGTLDTRCKHYEITLGKSSGWVLLTTLDNEVLSHINDASLVVILKNQTEYEYTYYAGNTYIVGNALIGYNSGYAVYGMSHRTTKDTSTSANVVYYPANKTDTSTSLGGTCMFRLDGNKYYIRPGDGYVYAGTYKLTFTW